MIDLKIAVCGLVGRDQEQWESVTRLLSLVSNATIARLDAGVTNWMPREIRDVFTIGLRKAGLPEG